VPANSPVRPVGVALVITSSSLMANAPECAPAVPSPCQSSVAAPAKTFFCRRLSGERRVNTEVVDAAFDLAEVFVRRVDADGAIGLEPVVAGPHLGIGHVQLVVLRTIEMRAEAGGSDS